MPQQKSEDICSELLDYFKRNYRPYNVNDVFTNHHGKFPKSSIQKAIDSLVSSGNLIEKVYNKQKVYLYYEKMTNSTPQDLSKLRATLSELEIDLSTALKHEKTLDSVISKNQIQMSNFDINTKIMELEKELTDYKEKIKQCETNKISESDIKDIKKIFKEFHHKWRQRRRITNDILNMMLESSEKSKKELMNELCIETDEDYNVDIANFDENDF